MAEPLKPTGLFAAAVIVGLMFPQGRAAAVELVHSALPSSASSASPAGPGSAGVTCRMLPAGIRQQESGGRYGVQGVPVASHGGARAQGAYQVMPAHLTGRGSWARESLGRDVTPAEFRGSRKFQDKLAGDQLGQLCHRYGPRGAAAAWYSGRPELHNDTRNRGGGAASVKAYTDNVMALSRRYGK